MCDNLVRVARFRLLYREMCCDRPQMKPNEIDQGCGQFGAQCDLHSSARSKGVFFQVLKVRVRENHVSICKIHHSVTLLAVQVSS